MTANSLIVDNSITIITIHIHSYTDKTGDIKQVFINEESFVNEHNVCIIPCMQMNILCITVISLPYLNWNKI